MSANGMQSFFIQHYYRRQIVRRPDLTLEQAAHEWISKRALAFRRWYTRRYG